ncbi:uncharacterized protein BJ212DRAFT_1476064 [Suillus subaureus]|uniref:Uncharacterized protein n=1 Tax=Suillus subaureus TaxID=48587 RepID=A0A9P7ELD0_9AGAM|nr:uncharacterized protein BJ212DRAFT_1476064 [Suillus subaureus]KAG1824779.1 hypothetical protein BJ212DRAFT_1476064 [Suillus subaureus]
MAIVSPGNIDLGMIKNSSLFRTKTLNAFLLATSDFLSNLLDVSNLSSGCSFRYFKLQHQSTIAVITSQQMACALGSDGKLKDASAIDWYNDPDDDFPIPTPSPPSASNGTLTAFVSFCSGRALKPTEKIHEAANTALAKQLAPVPPQGQPALKQVQTGSCLVHYHDNNDNDIYYDNVPSNVLCHPST